MLLGPCPAPLRHRSLSQLHPRLYTSLPVFRLYSLLWILSFLSLSIPLLSLSLRWITAGFSIVTCCWWQSNWLISRLLPRDDNAHSSFLGSCLEPPPTPPSPLRIFATNNQLNFTPPRSLYARRGSFPSYFRHYRPVISSIALLSIF